MAIHTPTETGATEPQYMKALGRANAIRLARAERKRWLRADGNRQESRRRAAALLDAIPPEMETCTIGDYLHAVHRIGDTTAHRIVRDVGCSEHRTLGAMTKRQIALFKALLLRNVTDA